jgi:hypothetical protein
MTDMNITVTIQIPQLDAVMALLQGKDVPTPAPKGTSDPAAADTAASGTAEDTAPKRTRRTAAQIAADEAAKAAPADDGPKVLDYETVVKPAIINLGQVKGRDAAKAMLQEFNVTAGTELDTAVYPAVLKRIDELLQPDEPALA